MKTLNCPKGHGPMGFNTAQKEMTFKGVDIALEVEVYTCPECSLEAGTLQSTGAVQRALADAWQDKVDLLTGQEIKSLREAKGFTQQGRLGTSMLLCFTNPPCFATFPKCHDKRASMHLGRCTTSSFGGSSAEKFFVPMGIGGDLLIAWRTSPPRAVPSAWPGR